METKTNEWVFTAVPLYTYGTEVLAKHAVANMGIKTFVDCYENLEFGIALHDTLKDVLPKAGGKLLASFPMERDADYTPVIINIKKLNPDAIYLGFVVKETVAVLRLYKEYGLKSQILGITEYEVAFQKAAKCLAEGGIYMIPGYDINSPEAQPFVKAWKERYKTDPPFFAHWGWKPIANILYPTVKYMQDRNLGINGQNIRNALADIKDFNTIAGRITFRKFPNAGYSVAGDMWMNKIENCNIVTLQKFIHR